MKSALTYERMAQGELGHGAEDEKELNRLAVESRKFLKDHPPESISSRRRRPIWWAPAAAAALALVLWSPWSPHREERVKSAAQTLLVYHKTSQGNELLGSGAALSQGEEVQLAYLAPHRYVAILSVDGRGTVTAHLPLHGGSAVVAESERAELLPYSYRLDDAPRFETMVLVSSAKEFSLETLRPFLQAWAASPGAPLLLPAGLDATLFRIAKKETPQ